MMAYLEGDVGAADAAKPEPAEEAKPGDKSYFFRKSTDCFARVVESTP
jgi:hypothetical protein